MNQILVDNDNLLVSLSLKRRGDLLFHISEEGIKRRLKTQVEPNFF
jgi:hypothetical protein